MMRLDALETLPSGAKGVRVTLFFQAQLSSLPRSARRDRLREEFSRVVQLIPTLRATADFGSLSVSGQSIVAVIPVDEYDRIEAELSGLGVRVDPLEDVQLLNSANG